MEINYCVYQGTVTKGGFDRGRHLSCEIKLVCRTRLPARPRLSENVSANPAGDTLINGPGVLN